ncbi:0fb3b0b0-a4c8-4d97-afd4-ddaad54e19b3 [Sclerotinia trifoliorum]|uniref:0fb3b0b0-a4c8-4d97-afd4-ddaad54e19b3 n=1 Tax=Sclerotinia trifoliorum TaxID=28548 RepID=A0A8H2W3Q2_9HELO|nr:0fb3b0b0-a4c8-4d97-afd4-ddaad54e19b3 [Sclerotinia trifoliorum]
MVSPIPTLLTTQFLLSHLLQSSRLPKRFLHKTSNVSPRQDLTHFPTKDLSQSTINMLLRWEAAQQNAMDNFPIFVAAVLFASFKGVSEDTVASVGWCYVGARLAYWVSYVLAERVKWSFLRSAFWWVGNGICFWLLREGGRV